FCETHCAALLWLKQPVKRYRGKHYASIEPETGSLCMPQKENLKRGRDWRPYGISRATRLLKSLEQSRSDDLACCSLDLGRCLKYDVIEGEPANVEPSSTAAIEDRQPIRARSNALPNRAKHCGIEMRTEVSFKEALLSQTRQREHVGRTRDARPH